MKSDEGELCTCFCDLGFDPDGFERDSFGLSQHDEECHIHWGRVRIIQIGSTPMSDLADLRERFDALMGDRSTPELFEVFVKSHEDLASEYNVSLDEAVDLIWGPSGETR